MANIGSTLRDTRIRNKIDISSVEQSTKIRAKYLRALENEEWSVLPGPTYVKSFLRTYAEYLGLDPHVLLEEYGARYEEPEELELAAFRREAPIREKVGRFGPPSRGMLVGILIVAFVVFLFILGVTGKGGGGGEQQSSQPSGGSAQGGLEPARRTAAQRRRERRRKQQEQAARSGMVSVEVTPTRDVWVCLVDAAGNARIDGEVLAGGDRRGPFHSKRFGITLGNGGGDFKVNDRKRNVPETSKPISYTITPEGVDTTNNGPSCA